jgi:hypothetical protein
MVQKQNAPQAALFLLVALVARAASAIPDGETLETKMLCLSKNSFSAFDKQIGCLMSSVIDF